MTPAHLARFESAGQRVRKRPPKEVYTTNAIRRAVHRACVKGNVPVWGINRLRHNRATDLRPFGLDVVGTVLGHTRLETTQIYSEKNLDTAKELVAKVG
jgi:site-specific recombinase XerD